MDGRPTGSVRISFGYMSTFSDAETFVSFVEQNFCCHSGHDSDDVMKNSSHLIGREKDDVIPRVEKPLDEEKLRVREMEGGRDGQGVGEMMLRVGDVVKASAQTVGNAYLRGGGII